MAPEEEGLGTGRLGGAWGPCQLTFPAEGPDTAQAGLGLSVREEGWQGGNELNPPPAACASLWLLQPFAERGEVPSPAWKLHRWLV